MITGMTPENMGFLLQDGPVIVFVCDPKDWSVKYVSANIAEYTGFEASTFYASHQFWSSRVHPEDAPGLSNTYKVLLDTGTRSGEYRFRKADGHYTWLRFEIRLIRDEVVGYLTDISEVKALADQLALELSRTQAILTAIPDNLFELDKEGYCLFHGSPSQHIVGKSLVDFMPQDVAELSINAVKRALSTNDLQTIKYSQLQDGVRKYFQAQVAPSSRGTVVFIVRDISEEIGHSLELEDKTQVLEEANESLEQFVYVASHDLREPLTHVAGYVTLLQRRYDDKLDDQGRHFLEEAVLGLGRLSAKIDDLLALSRAGRGSLSGTFLLEDAIEEAQRSLIGPIKTSHTVVTLPLSLPVVRGDRGQVAQIFQNLFSNSVKYRTGETPQIEVGIGLSEDDPGMWVISVKDNGLGFDMKHVDRIFGVFQRLYTVSQYPGTGIGLAIVKKIVERHGGRVWAESEPTKGSTFFFTLKQV